MKKNEAAKAEEKKLVWKFKELPTAGEVSELVNTKVITPEEARSILFKEEVKQSDEVEALKEMVKTLQEMVSDLLSRPNIQYVPYTKVIEVPRRLRPYWETWMSTGNTTYGMSTSSRVDNNGNTVYTLSANQ